MELFKNKSRKRKSIHRLVAIAFIPNPEGKPQVNHKDENKLNNSVDNLDRNTPKENINYGSRTKRQRSNTDYTTKQRKNIAIKNGKLTSKPVLQILDGKTIAKYENAKTASRVLKINASHIGEVCKKKRKTAGGYLWEYERGNDLSAFQ
ncbi:MAG: hypothetical protein HFE78_07415 [Clostridiales bacterium]|nr:hypothetical protein [Clostridiales bacterium]